MQDKLEQDLNQALKSGDRDKVSVLRMVRSSLTNARIDKGELSDSDVVALLQKEAKQRKDSIDSYKSANRQDLVDKEVIELEIIESYLPTPLSKEELEEMVDGAISAVGASSMSDMGKVMGHLKDKTAGKADGSEVSQIVRTKLS